MREGESRALVAVKETTALQPRRTRDLVTDLVRNAGVLLRAEAQLLRLDLVDAARRAEERAKTTGAALAMMHTGVLLVAVALYLGLNELLPPWLAALAGGAVFIAGGVALLARNGDRHKRTLTKDLREGDTDGRAEEPRARG